MLHATQQRALFAYPVTEPSVAAALETRAKALTSGQLELAVATGANALLIPAALDELSDAGSYRSAEHRMGALVMPLAHHLRAADLRRRAHIVRENDQVRMAAAMPQMLDELFERSRAVPEAMPVWRELSEWLIANDPDNDPDSWYAYPDLARSIAAFDAKLNWG